VSQVPHPNGLVDQVSEAIGQGRVLATPVQMAVVAADVAAGGYVKPHVVEVPVPAAVEPMTPGVAATLQDFMRGVVANGTGTKARLPGTPVAGKTGTAEFGARDSLGRLPFHNWFVAFVPAKGDVARRDSKLAVIAFAYDSNTVGNAATEMVKYYLQLHYKLKVDKRLPYLLDRGNFYGGN
jgi:cell division protein FtsI/penicillin-binding protein 2